MTTGLVRRSFRAATRLLVPFALLAVAATVACGGESSSGSSAAGDGTGDGASGGAEVDPVEAADRSAELHFALNYGFNSLDPHRSPSALGDANWMRPLYDRLLTLVDGDDGGVELAPQLATSYEVADDGLSVSFELRDDVDFQDGTHFDAEAVKANIERAQGPESTVASTLESIESVEVVDATHVVLHLSRPDPSIPWAMAIGTTGMMISPAAIEGDTDLASEPAGSGPFRLVSAQKDADVVYERWEDHWDGDAALAQRLVISTIPDVNARYNGLRSGEYDAAFLQPPHDAEAESLEGEGYHYENELGPISYGVLLNAAKPPLDDVRVRRAVSLALNRTEISEELLGGVNPPAFQAFNDGYLGHDPALDEDPYDPDEARRLVEAAGAEGARIEIVQQTTPPQDALAEVVQQSLTDIGLEVELVPLSPTEARPAWTEGSHGGFVGPIIAQPEPAQTLGQSYLAGDNPAPPPDDLVQLAEDALGLPVDSAEREAAYQEINAYLVENPVHVPIVRFSTVVVARPDVVGSDNILLMNLGNFDFRRVGIAEG